MHLCDDTCVDRSVIKRYIQIHLGSECFSWLVAYKLYSYSLAIETVSFP